jgi:demethylmenaquinone methyltransferase / 2-methoxy-6-polyprenyl-1,4-benzoquinol methylase
MIEALPDERRADEVRRMFGSIAGRYDATNSVLSGGMHHLWRRRAVRDLDPAPDARILDVCCGTGDLALGVAGALGDDGEVVGTDFTPEMVELASAKVAGRSERPALSFSVADATALPFEDDSFDGATVGFGIRNVVDPVAAARELARVVRPGGRVMVLEFGQPDGLLAGPAYRLYSKLVMPRIGGLMTGNREAYEYLPRTSAAFPAGHDFVEQVFAPAGLRTVLTRPLFGAIAWIYLGEVVR